MNPTVLHFDFGDFFATGICLLTAFVLGAIIGYERQVRQRTAGLRTNTLVAVGAAVFVNMAYGLAGADGAARVTAYVVSGVGFLGAGTIMKEGLNVRGLNTAATLWGSAAVGACAGAGILDKALLAAVFVLCSNTLLRPIVNAINRQPIDDDASEVTHQICMIVGEAEQKHALAHLDMLLEKAGYPVGDMDIEPFGDDDVQITATLLSTSVESEVLDKITEELASYNFIKQVFWNPSFTE